MRTAELVGKDTAISVRPYRFLGSYRFILAMLVLMSHTSSFLSPVVNGLRLGNVGVLLFFVVSGFVICEACDVFYRGRIGNFLLNRALKIYPAYWAATIGAYWIFTHIDPRINPDIPTVDFSPWALLVNATLLLGYLKQGNNLVIISQTWAILTEFQFYFIAAFLFFLAPRFRKPGAWLGAAAAAALACHVYVWATGSQTRFFGQLFHAPFFVFGGAWYFLMTRRATPGLRLLTIVAALLSLHAYFAYNELSPTGINAPWDWSRGLPWDLLRTTAIFAAGLLLFVVLAQTRATPAVEQTDKRLGDLTYAIYLVHHPLAELAIGLGLAGLPAFGFVVALSIGEAVAIHRLIERPAVGLRNKLRGVRLYD